MAELTVIGRGTRVRGRVTGAVDLEIQGFVDGEVAIEGDVTVDAQGLVSANVSARRLVVRGAVRGDLTGEEIVLLEDGARVVGDVRAPRVAVAPGALVRGYVQTAGMNGSAASAPRRAQPARETPAPRVQPAASSATRPQPAAAARATRPAAPSVARPAVTPPPPAPAPRSTPAASSRGGSTAGRGPGPGRPSGSSRTSSTNHVSGTATPPPASQTRTSISTSTSPKGPPAPVVPALKKGARGAIRKKA
jgi:cytoskeletal protein CcmA (bactofilin family)